MIFIFQGTAQHFELVKVFVVIFKDIRISETASRGKVSCVQDYIQGDQLNMAVFFWYFNWLPCRTRILVSKFCFWFCLKIAGNGFGQFLHNFWPKKPYYRKIF